MSEVYFPIYNDLLHKLNNLSEKSENLTEELKRSNGKLDNLKNIKESILLKIQTFKGIPADQQLTHNWKHVLQEIRKTQQQISSLQAERDKLGKKEEVLEGARQLAFNQFKNKKPRPKSILGFGNDSLWDNNSDSQSIY
ncbi:MAG TPA: hypothetical protein P5556_01825 [Candidatus Gastranaerophilales bacterium]|nr:hypothetical protein [Candidatus Gastranaerophilales bacterium]